MRDIRDYLTKVRPDELSQGPASPFNVKMESLTLPDFTAEEIRTLYGQHTTETGQVFDTSAVDRAWYWTGGQPWLVNALANNVIVKQFGNDFSRVITGKEIDLAVSNLILRNDTHFDSLIERLREPRIRRVIEPVLIGAGSIPKNFSNDVEYTIDLGLLKKDPGDAASLRVANPIYGEIIVRSLTKNLQETIPVELANRWTDGTRLDMDGLLKAFQLYWRINANMNAKALGKADKRKSREKERIDWVLSIPELANQYDIQEQLIEIIKEKRTGFSSEDIPHNVLNAFLQRS
ncbi:MAG: hypothetical protein LBQ79_12315 [Deltaproteobacteria bacterium]|jgi:hypothetical protein|nr:hypothetical protein [Deltaproteobacteria bacterium]